MSTDTGKIFNIQQDGPDSQFQTTAAQAQADAPTATESRKVEDNAEAAKISAQEVADFAQSKGKEFTGEPPTATEKLQSQAKGIADTAVAEGKQDVNAASASAESYLDQAKAIANQVLASAQATAQQYIPDSTTGQTKDASSAGTGGLSGQLKDQGAAAIEAAKEYLAQAQTAAQPTIEKAKEYLASVQGQSQTAHPTPPTVPASTAPLQAGISLNWSQKRLLMMSGLLPTYHHHGARVLSSAWLLDHILIHSLQDSFVNLAKQGYEAYSKKDSDSASKTGGQEYNDGPTSSGPNIDHDEAVQKAGKHGSEGDKDLFSTAMSFISNNIGDHNAPVDEADAVKAHDKAYGQNSASSLDARSMGSAAALQVLKKFTSGGSSESSGKSKTDLISMAMAEAAKLFDKSGGTASGNKQDAVNGAAMTIMKLFVQSKASGTTGGSNSGGLGQLMSLAQQFAK
ncbi:hypothetical protein CYLTODRAFT_442864 [Cylindrobasidium torrendii FP15055 ss-10]|uniref:DUF7721 domain-containing protein n=1 Tax=Cylindrobasidium torrendii FP15055 ss-10 TaxID=1314674 RepID=A0A0D7BHM5_9AGAR|nr:hypothetical protein CYLTODRAFT_442864 [Cylindrobasidium torrendii FP15055 ss-10]